MKVADTRHVDHHVGAGAGIAGMFGQVQDETAARDLGVEREVVAEAVFPVDREAEEAAIEFMRLGNVEYAHDRQGGLEGNAA